MVLVLYLKLEKLSKLLSIKVCVVCILSYMLAYHDLLESGCSYMKAVFNWKSGRSLFLSMNH